MSTVSIRLDDDEKMDLEEMCAQMGMSISTFYMICTKKALRDRCIPFEVTASKDPFYSASNMRQLRKADQQIRSGQVVEKTLEELEALDE
ncbi:MAG: type II toxin-antitoxin system RelB/DinJ family antitoxin [Lachnospiraceae bacterium]|nr:type II toxin-antitoxin system RelB/DinJ family antitoxin [Lachnospiraceae bacterium]